MDGGHPAPAVHLVGGADQINPQWTTTWPRTSCGTVIVLSTPPANSTPSIRALYLLADLDTTASQPSCHWFHAARKAAALLKAPHRHDSLHHAVVVGASAVEQAQPSTTTPSPRRAG
jgi:hypothetical protein